MTRSTRGAISICVFVAVWELTARMGWAPAPLFPPPTRVLAAFGEMWRSGELVRDLRASLWRALVGITLGSAAGVAVGLLTGRREVINSFFTPLIQLLRPLPPVALIPVIIVWFGIGEFSKVFSISFAVFFPVWINAHIGAREVPKTFLWSAQTFRLTQLRVLITVIFPCALPFIVAGFRNGIAVAFVMVFVSELAGASAGVGYQISVSYLAYRVDRMIAALALLGVLGALTDVLLLRALRVVFPWLRYSE